MVPAPQSILPALRPPRLPRQTNRELRHWGRRLGALVESLLDDTVRTPQGGMRLVPRCHPTSPSGKGHHPFCPVVPSTPGRQASSAVHSGSSRPGHPGCKRWVLGCCDAKRPMETVVRHGCSLCSCVSPIPSNCSSVRAGRPLPRRIMISELALLWGAGVSVRALWVLRDGAPCTCGAGCPYCAGCMCPPAGRVIPHPSLPLPPPPPPV